MNKKSSCSDQLEAMEQLLKDNLRQACIDIVEWNSTGILVNGIVRKSAQLLTDEVFRFHKLTHVKNCIDRLAREFVINNA